MVTFPDWKRLIVLTNSSCIKIDLVYSESYTHLRPLRAACLGCRAEIHWGLELCSWNEGEEGKLVTFNLIFFAGSCF